MSSMVIIIVKRVFIGSGSYKILEASNPLEYFLVRYTELVYKVVTPIYSFTYTLLLVSLYNLLTHFDSFPRMTDLRTRF